LSKANYLTFKKDTVEFNEWHKGYAIAIDNLLQTFEECMQEVITEEEKPQEQEWM
jgi:hypothetical protein